MIHLVIIDAFNLIRRIHSAQPKTATITATITTSCQTLKRILAQTQPTHVVAVFDHPQPQSPWRREILPSYKQDRKPMPQDLQAALEDIQAAWWELGIESLLSEGDEADDLIASLAVKLIQHQKKVTIISTDKGYCQLLSPYVQIRDYFQQRWLDVTFIEQEFGVKPSQLTDFWGLAGIASSQVSGVPGLGPKAARDILSSYDTIEQAYASGQLPEKYRKKLQTHIALARQCKAVAQLKTDIEFGFNLQDIRYQPQSTSE